MNDAIDRQRDDGIRAGILVRASCSRRARCSRCSPWPPCIAVGVAQGPASGLTTGAMVGFIFLVYRFLEPIAEFTEILDQTQTAVAGWRRVLAVLETPIEIAEPADGVDLPHDAPAHRGGPRHVRLPAPARARPPTRSSRRCVDVTFTIEPAHERRRRRAPPARASRRWPSCSPAWPTRRRGGAGGRRRPARRPHGVAAGDARDGAAGAVPVRHHDHRERALRPARRHRRRGAAGVRRARPRRLARRRWPTGIAHPGRASGASTSRPASASSWRWPGPTWPTRRASSSTRRRRPSTRPPRLAWPAPWRAWPAGRTSVTIAHRLSTAARADWVLVFDRGRLVEQGRHDDLLAAGGVYAALHASGSTPPPPSPSDGVSAASAGPSQRCARAMLG